MQRLAVVLLAGLLSIGTGLPGQAGSDRVALIVGVGSYEHGPNLENTRHDAIVLASRFRELGYDTILRLDPDRAEMLTTLAQLRLVASDASQVVIYFAGHGVQANGGSYLMLRDTPMTEAGMRSAAIPLRAVVKAIADKPRQKILLLDACRDNPVYQGRTALPPRSAFAPAGLLVGYASQPGAPSFDGAGRHSPFAQALLDQLSKPQRSVPEILRRVRLDVLLKTDGLQVPWAQSSLLRDAFFWPEGS